MKGKWQDSFLAAAASAGDSQAFGRLYDKYAERIFRFIAWRVGSREEAQDLTAEVFLRVWQYISGRNAGVEHFQALLYRIASNAVVDYHRQKGKRASLIDNIDEWPGLVDSRSDLESQLARQEDWQEVNRLLGEISSSERELLLMKYVEDLTTAEIAKILDKTQAAVRVALHRAVKSLKTRIKEAKER